MSSTSTSSLALLATAIGNIIIIAVGAIVSMVVPMVLITDIVDLATALELQLNGEAANAKESFIDDWGFVVFMLPNLLLVYIAASHLYYLQLGSVFESVLRAVAWVVGGSVSVAICWVAVFWVGAKLLSLIQGTEGKGIKEAKE